MKILNIVGARPNFIKIAPIIHQMKEGGQFTPLLLHTGQHYNENMNHVFFEQLGIPRPDYNLEVGSASNPKQISKIIDRFEPVLLKEKPDAILVVGDVNSTISCALVAAHLETPIIHVEAGLRSFDRSMPEEVNRLLTDQLAEWLFITESSARQNLLNEGVRADKIHFVGNVMVDSLMKHLAVAGQNSGALGKLGLSKNEYALMTLHRPSNVDRPENLKAILQAIAELAVEIPLVFTIHPRTEKRVDEFNLRHLLKPLRTLAPLPYLDMIHLMANAALVLTDSGGIQEETTILDIPCLTLRENTERPVTIEKGSNTLVGVDTEKILSEARKVLRGEGKKGQTPELWDGRAAERIVEILARSCN